MNKQGHIAIGVITFLIYLGCYAAIGIQVNFVYGIIAAIVGSVLPDIFEPATNWMHRGVCHSKRTLKLTGMIFFVSIFLNLLTFLISIFSVFYIVSCFFLGYFAHLLVDSTSTVGLPD